MHIVNNNDAPTAAYHADEKSVKTPVNTPNVTLPTLPKNALLTPIFVRSPYTISESKPVFRNCAKLSFKATLSTSLEALG